MKKIIQFLGLRRSIVGLLSMVVLVGMTAFAFGAIGTVWFAWKGKDFSTSPTTSLLKDNKSAS